MPETRFLKNALRWLGNRGNLSHEVSRNDVIFDVLSVLRQAVTNREHDIGVECPLWWVWQHTVEIVQPTTCIGQGVSRDTLVWRTPTNLGAKTVMVSTNPWLQIDRDMPGES